MGKLSRMLRQRGVVFVLRRLWGLARTAVLTLFYGIFTGLKGEGYRVQGCRC